MSAPAFGVRAGQREFERGVKLHRVCGMLARRQYGKTTIAARIANFKMMKTPGHTVIFGSVKLDLGREIVRKELAQLTDAFRLTATGGGLLQLTDSATGKPLPVMNSDDFAALYDASRLEFRLHHDRTTYSRTKVVALTPDAVGETGDLILDEVGRVKNFRDVLEAIMPIIASNPAFRAIYTTTPPPDDTHPSFDLLAPPIGAELPISPTGNWYRSELGVHVLRITAEDAYADGVQLFDDDTGAPISPAESRQRAHDKDAWDRNYACQFIIGGTSVCPLLELDTAQRRGIGQCFCEVANDDRAFDAAVARLESLLTGGTVAGGWDLASTEKATSNPSSFTIMESVNGEYVSRGVLLWKTANPALQLERARKIIAVIGARKAGGRMRRLAIDATGDRLFARTIQTELSRDGVPVELVVASETVRMPGYDSPVTRKTWMGDRYVAALSDNKHTFPPERYFREDHRMPKKIKGVYVTDPASDGKHGDTFDSGKLALHALTARGGDFSYAPVVREGGGRRFARGRVCA